MKYHISQSMAGLKRGPIGNSFIRCSFPDNLHQGLYMYVLDKPRVDYTLARAPFSASCPIGSSWSNWHNVGPGSEHPTASLPARLRQR